MQLPGRRSPFILRAAPRHAGVWFNGNIRPFRLKPEQPWECKSPHADQPSLGAERREKAAAPKSVRTKAGHGTQSSRRSELRLGKPNFNWSVGVLEKWEAGKGLRSLGHRSPLQYSNTPSPHFSRRKVNRTSEPGLGANECMPSGRWCKSAFRQPSPTAQRSAKAVASKRAARRRTAFVHTSGLRLGKPCARSSKRAVRLISGIALDECRVPERYRTRAPIFSLHLRARSRSNDPAQREHKPVEETGRRCVSLSAVSKFPACG